jgi:ELWxxDGT repeat protein
MRLWISVSLLALAVPAAALTPHLVKDINPVPSSQGSAPADYVTVGNLAFFTATDSITGRELWRTDGTEAGTFQVVDACPGECIGDPRFVAQNGTSYFFVASSGGPGEELWISGGTPANTFRLTDTMHFPNVIEGIWSVWVASQGLLYFAADDGTHGRELWRTDGTPAGTHLVADVQPGLVGSNPRDLTDFEAQLYFRADDAQRGSLLWRSDGTAAGTQAILDPIPNSVSHPGPAFFNVVGRTLYFVAPVRGRGPQLWKTDGTPKGTSALTNIRFSQSSPAFLDFTRLGNRLLFVAFDPARGQELWASDGTTKGTGPLTNLPRVEAFFRRNESPRVPLPRVPLGNRMIFQVNDGPHGQELWTTDGTPRGTRLIRDLCLGPCSGAALEPVVLNGRVFFSGSVTGEHPDPWVTDGTAAGTRIVRDICGDNCFSTPSGWHVGGGKAFFVFNETNLDGIPRNVAQLWRTDGTSQGTIRLTSIDFGGLEVDEFRGVFLGGKLLFTALDREHGDEPWLSDGTPQGTRLVADLNIKDLGGSNPSFLTAAGGKVYFIAFDGVHGTGLWRSDGTEEGTTLLVDLDPFPAGEVRPAFLTGSAEAGGRFFFALSTGRGYSLWVSDGTPAGTMRLSADDVDIAPQLVAVGNQVFFPASDTLNGPHQQLWKSDGTPEGTRIAVKFSVGQSGGPAPGNLTAFQGRLYFTAFVAQLGYELWSSDGTPGGTVLVKDIYPQSFAGSRPRVLTEHAGRLYFFADDAHGTHLWSTDGTAAGTTRIDVDTGAGFFLGSAIFSAGSRLFLWGGTAGENIGLWVSDGTAAGTTRIGDGDLYHLSPLARPFLFHEEIYFGRTSAGELWKSDGTAAGTVQLLDREGRAIHTPLSFRNFAGRLLFTTLRTGSLYQSDGTREGTFRFLELRPPFATPLIELAPVGPRLLFSKWDADNGWELWGLEGE